MEMPNIDAVVFDIGNVLIEWQPERYYDSVIGEERRRAMFAEVDLHGMNDRIDMGGHFRDVIYETAEAYPAWRNEICMWYDSWINLAEPAIDHSVALLRALRKRGVPVFSLTNFGVQSFDYAATVYPFLHEFDQQYISGHMKVIKPSPEIYQGVEGGSGIAPSRLLFADDRVDNVEAARLRGWQVHLFEGPRGWAERLVAEGLLSPEEAGIAPCA